MNDTFIEKLGIYFVHFKVYENHGIPFETFVDRCSRGIDVLGLGWYE